MNVNLLRYSLRSGLVVALIWSTASTLFGVLIVALAPSFEGLDFLAIAEQMPPAMRRALLGSLGDLAVFERDTYLAYMATQYFTLWLPIMLGLYPLFGMGGAVARESERGTLGILLAQPIARWKVCVSKYVAFVFYAMVVVVATALGLIVGEGLAGIETPIDRAALLQVYVNLWLFMLAIGALALAFSVWFLAAGPAWGAVGIVLFVSFLFNIMGGFETFVAKVQYLSLLYYWQPQGLLVEPEITLQPMLVYGGVAVAAFGAALAVFQRREIAG